MPYIGAVPDKGNFADLNGAKLILDADADTSITADTDDQIDIEIAGSDELKITAAMIAPATADGSALGGTSNEWSDLYLADGGVINLGTDQDVTITHDPDDGLFFKSTATADDNPFLFTLQTGETDLAVNDVIGKIAFQAPDEGTGTDAILVSGAIQARAEGDHSSSSNATSLDFMTGASEAATTKWSITSAGSFLNAGTNTIDMNAGELILDANGNTSITADTDDQIDFKIAGADDFRMTANSFNVLSGSTLTIDSGATITNSGTANNFGVDPESAYTGVLETNANFVNQVIFGPAVDGRPWNGKWSVASLYSSLMLATIEDTGSNTEVNIWDLTEQSSGTIGTTALGTVTLSGDATPTSVDAAMGYIIVGSEDGISIIDPHGGSWAERTSGWPRTLSTSTSPALGSNDVDDVAATILPAAPKDARTGGPMPTFRVSSDSTTNAILANDGVPHNAEVTSTHTAGWNGVTAIVRESNNAIRMASAWRLEKKGDNGDEIVYSTGSTGGLHLIANEAANTLNAGPSKTGTMFAHGQASGLNLIDQNLLINGQTNGMIAHINRTYNTGYMVGDIRGAWLANSKTADRSFKGDTLTENGTVTEGAVESGAELNGYSNFTASNYFSRAYDADLDFGTGDFSVMGWFKQAASSTYETMIDRADTSPVQRWYVRLDNAGLINTNIGDGTNVINPSSPSGTVYDDGVWHQVVLTFDGTAKTGTLYADGVQVATATNASIGSLSDGSAILRIGNLVNATTYPFNGTLALWRASASAPSYAQIRAMYEAEKGMFVASAECLLQSGTTDAVLDVDVDPLTGKVLVTQTDAITIFDGLVVDSKPTVNSGNSEKGKLWGDLRTEQNSANAYVTAPAVDQRQVNEMVRGLANDMPKGVDLSKAKAWIHFDGDGTVAIRSSYNISALTDSSTGQYDIDFAVPFKSTDGMIFVSTAQVKDINGFADIGAVTVNDARIRTLSHAGNLTDSDKIYVVVFGELENE